VTNVQLRAAIPDHMMNLIKQRGKKAGFEVLPHPVGAPSKLLQIWAVMSCMRSQRTVCPQSLAVMCRCTVMQHRSVDTATGLVMGEI
jgi:hypothetical protein